MKIQSKILKILLSFLIIGLCFSCTESSNNDASDNSVSESSSSNDSRRSARTDCGIPVNGRLQNPLTLNSNSIFSASGISGTLAKVKISGDNFKVKLSGVIEKPGQASAVSNQISQLSRNGVFFVESLDNCTSVRNGDPVLVGQLITPGGASISEVLLVQGLVNPDRSDTCVPSQLISCYDALQDTASSNSGSNSTNTSNNDNDESSEEKPAEEEKASGGFSFNPTGNGGKLQITTLSNVGIVTVNGERGRKSGNKFNFSKPGCSYGGSAKVKGFTSTAVATALTKSGKKSITLNGCNRRSE